MDDRFWRKALRVEFDRFWLQALRVHCGRQICDQIGPEFGHQICDQIGPEKELDLAAQKLVWLAKKMARETNNKKAERPKILKSKNVALARNDITMHARPEPILGLAMLPGAIQTGLTGTSSAPLPPIDS